MIKELRIDSYKFLKELKIDGIKQLNLIVGKNSIGKSSLLEFIGIATRESVGSILDTLKNLFFNKRGLPLDFYEAFLEKSKISGFVNNKSFLFLSKKAEELLPHELELAKRVIQPLSAKELFYLFYKDDQLIELTHKNSLFSARDINFPLELNLSYLDSSVQKDVKNLAFLYKKIQENGLQDQFLEYIRLFDNEIVKIEPSISLIGYTQEPLQRSPIYDMMLYVTLKNGDFTPIGVLGEGAIKIAFIASAVLFSENGYFLIDEFENGLYYTKLKDAWKIIINAIKNRQTQVFATTHDNETVKALYEAAKELDFKDIALVRIVKNDNKLTCSTYDIEHLEVEIEANRELRGW